MGLEDLVSKNKGAKEFEQDGSTSDNELTHSLRLLIERNNPMADAAEKALDRL